MLNYDEPYGAQFFCSWLISNFLKQVIPHFHFWIVTYSAETKKTTKNLYYVFSFSPRNLKHNFFFCTAHSWFCLSFSWSNISFAVMKQFILWMDNNSFVKLFCVELVENKTDKPDLCSKIICKRWWPGEPRSLGKRFQRIMVYRKNKLWIENKIWYRFWLHKCC